MDSKSPVVAAVVVVVVVAVAVAVAAVVAAAKVLPSRRRHFSHAEKSSQIFKTISEFHENSGFCKNVVFVRKYRIFANILRKSRIFAKILNFRKNLGFSQ